MTNHFSAQARWLGCAKVHKCCKKKRAFEKTGTVILGHACTRSQRHDRGAGRRSRSVLNNRNQRRHIQHIAIQLPRSHTIIQPCGHTYNKNEPLLLNHTCNGNEKCLVDCGQRRPSQRVNGSIHELCLLITRELLELCESSFDSLLLNVRIHLEVCTCLQFFQRRF